MSAVNNITKHLVLGTAGHVDHGKTTLIKAITGINPDRLKEEQERGLTIDLGFAFINLPGGRQIGIIDVPGHERFLKNMLAGASGVDVALLVIAADEGVMPQTREHLEILELLETRHGVVAITKTDMVDKEWLEIVIDDVKDTLKDTFLRNAKIIPVSGITGEGITDLVNEISRLADEAEQKSVEGPFRIPVDRVFTITGFGTVVTGTLVSGTLKVGDPITVLPENIQTRVRQIEVHGLRQNTAYAGTRVAVNLAGVDINDLSRGSVLLPPGYLQAAATLDASVTILPNSPRPLKNRTRIRLHIGAAEALGRAVVIGSEEIEPGGKGFVQLRLESPVVAARGDRFVLRFYSPTDILGGGIILDPAATKHKMNDQTIVERLQRSLKGDPEDIVRDAMAASEAGLVKNDIVKRTGYTDKDVSAYLKNLVQSGNVIEHGGRYFTRASYEGLATRIKSALESYYSSHPTKPGMLKEELRAQLGSRVDSKGFQSILALMEAENLVIVSEAIIRLPGFEPTLTEHQKQIAADIESEFKETLANPPLISDFERKYGAEAGDIIALLVERGVLVRISVDFLLHRDVLKETENALRNYLQESSQITVSQFRDLINSSRKYVVPLLEYFDDKKVTRRSGDLRVLYK